MTAQAIAYMGAIGRFYATGKPVLLPVETEKTGKRKSSASLIVSKSKGQR